MKPKLGLAVAGALLVLSVAAAADAPGILGRWMTEGGKSHVEIYACGRQLCGRIVWLREPNFPDGAPKTDRLNPDQAKRGRRIVGLVLLWGMAKGDPGEWEGGRIYNPEDGETYRATLKLRPDGKLAVRGYVGISVFGKSQVWQRVQ